MEDKELKDTWAAYDKKIEEGRILNLQSWALNLKCFEELQTHKAKSKLRRVTNSKLFTIILGIVYVLFLAFLVYGDGGRNIYFDVSMSMIALLTVIAIVVYIQHIVIIKKINYSDGITDMQERLSTLQASTINIGRILWLQLPFWSTFFWSPKMIADDPVKFCLIALPVTLLLSLLAIWLYRNISLKNKDRKWFKVLFSTPEWSSVRRAIEFMEEIELFKKDLVL